MTLFVHPLRCIPLLWWIITTKEWSAGWVGLCGWNQLWEDEEEAGTKDRSQQPTNEKTPCWPYRRPVMLGDWALRQQWDRNMAGSIVARLPAINLQSLAVTLLTAVIVHRSVADVSAGSPPASDEPPHRRFEYKYSFKGPHLAQSDGSIPFWIHSGSKFGSSCQHHRPAAPLERQTAFIWMGFKGSWSFYDFRSCLWFIQICRNSSCRGCSSFSFNFRQVTEHKVGNGPGCEFKYTNNLIKLIRKSLDIQFVDKWNVRERFFSAE